MLPTLSKWIAPALVVAALAVAGTPSARAGFTLTVQEDSGPIFTIAGPLNQSLDPTIISANIVALNGSLLYFQFNSLSAFSSALNTSLNATLTQTLDVTRTDFGDGSSHTLTIVARDDTFNVPAGNPKVMNTSATATFDHTALGDQRTFQSVFDATNSGGTMISTPANAFTFAPPAGLGPYSSQQPGVLTDLGVQPIPFTLTNTTVITMGDNNSALFGPQHVQTTGATTVQAVPEPGSMALGLISLPALLALGRRMRRLADA